MKKRAHRRLVARRRKAQMSHKPTHRRRAFRLYEAATSDGLSALREGRDAD